MRVERGSGAPRDTVGVGREQGSEGCTSSIRDAASRRKLPKASTVLVMPPNSELSCSYKRGREKGVTALLGRPGVSASVPSSTRLP